MVYITGGLHVSITDRVWALQTAVLPKRDQIVSNE